VVLQGLKILSFLTEHVGTVHYDRILVMDDGKVAEFDTVLNLFDKHDSIFRCLCNEAGLSRQDILRIRQESRQEDEVAAGPS
jgi:hypothetical protein